MKTYTPEEIFSAAESVCRQEGKPVEIWRIAKAAGIEGGGVIAALIRGAPVRRVMQFKYPPLGEQSVWIE